MRAAGSDVIERPDLAGSETGQDTGNWIVTVFNNEFNTYDEVIFILQIATRCTIKEAEIETWEIDHLGKSVVHHGAKEECSKAAQIIATIGIRVEVSEE